MLPLPYSENPEVVVVLLPSDAQYMRTSTTDGRYQVDVAEKDGKMVGLQIHDPRLSTWPQQDAVFELYKVRMASPRHVGRVSEIPDYMFEDPAFTPLIYMKDAMWRSPCNVRGFFKLLFKESNAN